MLWTSCPTVYTSLSLRSTQAAMSGAGAGGRPLYVHAQTHTCRRSTTLFFLLFLLLLLSFIPTVSASRPDEVGYGPGFDACGDNCQTALRIFCTEGRNAEQQQECWCGEPEYEVRMDKCLATCDGAVSDMSRQREVMGRFRQITCRGSVADDDEFAEYYSTRYAHVGGFVPKATRAAAPAVVGVSTTAAATRTPTATPSSARSSASRTTGSPTSSSTASASSSTAPPLPSATNALTPPAGSALPPGVIAGISAGSVTLFILFLLTAYFARRRRLRRRHSRSPPADPFGGFSPIDRSPPEFPSIGTRRSMAISNFLPWAPTRADSERHEIDPEPAVSDIRIVTPTTEMEVSSEEEARRREDEDVIYTDSDGSSGSSEWTDYGEFFYDVDLSPGGEFDRRIGAPRRESWLSGTRAGLAERGWGSYMGR